MEKQSMTVKEVAEKLRCSEWTVRRWAKSGRLPSARPGHVFVFDATEINRLFTESGPKLKPAPTSPESK